MIKATKIKLTRAEGRPHECVSVTIECNGHGTGDVFYASDQVLSAWAQTAPDNGGYDKCDFCVEYEDNETYEGRFDLVREDMGRFSKLGEHMRRFLGFLCGRYRPDHLNDEQWAAWAASRRNEEHTEEAAAFLDTYQIGIAPLPCDECGEAPALPGGICNACLLRAEVAGAP